MKKADALWLLASVAFAGLLLVAWQALSDTHVLSPVFFPSPARTYSALASGIRSGDLVLQLTSTTVHMIVGWLLASSVGIILGALIGTSPTARLFLGPLLEFFRPMPASAIVPIAIALLGLTERMVFTIILFGALWPVLLATIHGFSAVEPRLYEVSEVLGLNTFETIWKIALPSSMPDIVAGLRVALTVSLILTVVGEMLAGVSGLGQFIILAGRSFRAPDVFSGVVLLALLGLVSSTVLLLCERWALRWRPA